MEKVKSDLFNCPICFEIPEEEIFQCRNGHTICKSCIASLQLCPQCRVPFGRDSERIRNRAMEELVGGMEISCTQVDAGCQAKLLRQDLVEHYKTCKFRPPNFCKVLGNNECTCFSSKPTEVFQHFHKDHGLKPFVIMKKRILSGSLMKQMKHLNTMAGGTRVFKMPVEVKSESSSQESWQFLVCFKVDFELGDYSIFGVHFGSNSSDMSSSSHTMSIEVCSPGEETSWKWSGLPSHYKNVERSLKCPPIKIPIQYLLEDLCIDGEKVGLNFKLGFTLRNTAED